MPSLDLMERAGARAWRGSRPRSPARGRSGSWSARATTAATACVAARLLREDGHEVDVLASPTRRAAGRREANLDASRAPAGAFEPAARRLGRDRRRDARHRLRGRAARAGRRRRSGRSTRQDAPVVACDVPSGVERLDRRGARRGGAGAVDRDLPRLQGRPPRRTRQGARRARSRWSRSASRAGRPAPAARRADLRARARPRTRAGSASGSKFESGVVVVVGGSARAHRRARRWPRGRPQRAGRRLRAGGRARSRCSRPWTCGCSRR